jgi:hypothetical protein
MAAFICVKYEVGIVPIFLINLTLSMVRIWSAFTLESFGKLAMPFCNNTSNENTLVVFEVIGKIVITLLCVLFILFETTATGLVFCISLPKLLGQDLLTKFRLF